MASLWMMPLTAMKSSMQAGLKSNSGAREFGAGIRKAANMGSKIVEAISKEGSYELVRIYEKDSKQHMIFPRLYSDGSINYHDMELKRKKGDIKIADIFVYTSGENLSVTIKGIYDQFAGIIDKSNKTDSGSVPCLISAQPSVAGQEAGLFGLV